MIFRQGLLALLMALPLAAAAGDFATLLADGISYRQRGDLRLSLDALELATSAATTPQEKVLAAGELGATYLQARQLSQAEQHLHTAHAQAQGDDQARYAIDLGNLALARKQPAQALRRYREAGDLASARPATRLFAAANETRLLLSPRLLPRLENLANSCGQLPDGAEKIRLHLNLGGQAKALGQAGLRLAYEQFEQARQLAEAAAQPALLLEAYDSLAQLYEDQGRAEEARAFTERALTLHRQRQAGSGLLLVRLHWRLGRLAAAGNDAALALAAYQAAVDQIEAIRPDIPVDYEGERSSFRETLEPVYLGLADRLLLLADGQSGAARQHTLRRVRAVVELIKQSEMQDYLGDRCSVDVTRSSDDIRVDTGVAVFYPIIFPERLELLLETRDGLVRHSTPAKAEAFRQSALLFAAKLREDPESSLPEARSLYDQLIRPLRDELERAGIHTLVTVPDGVVRMLPLAALHDGQDYLLRRFAFATAPGLTMTHARADSGKMRSFVAGLSDPGPVVDKLAPRLLQSIARPAANGQVRSAHESLRLPGVRDEVGQLTLSLGGKSLLNEGFTLENFRRSLESGEFGIVHIASHGLFGGSGDQSFILTHDELLTMDALQASLNSEKLRQQRIRLLALSACETAGGNERAPLGIAGAALKARADAALGTLWPVEDQIAKQAMIRFYAEFIGNRASKAEALRRAQLEVLDQASSAHPYYWAPFIVVGDWH